MRWLALLSLLASPILGQDPTVAKEKKTRVEGQVLSVAGKPLKRATVRLEAASLMNQTNFSNYAVSTDSEGKFVFEDIAPGTYVLSAERAGYLRQWYGTKSPSFGAAQIKLDAASEMKDLEIKLTAQGIIAGRVVDEDGEPLPSFSVRALRWTYTNGRKQLQVKASQNSEADGTFVIGDLPAGRYLVSAENEGQGFLTPIEQFGKRKPVEAYLRTYFPNAIDAGSASLLDVGPGAEIRGIEIYVRQDRVFEIGGKIAPRVAWAAVVLTPKNTGGDPEQPSRLAAFDNNSGTFQFKNVTPGNYVIKSAAEAAAQDVAGESSRLHLVARLEVSVGNANVEDLVLPLIPGPAIKGLLKTEGQDRLTQASLPGVPLQIELRWVEEGSNRNVEVTQDGNFVAPVPLDVFRFRVIGLTDNNYAKSISFNGQDITGKDLDLTSGSAGELTILISPNGAEVTGIVRDADGKSVPGAVVQLCRDGAIEKTVSADHTGAFDVKGLAPGEYKAFAWDGDGDGVITDPDFRQSFQSKTATVKLSEKSRENLELTLITKDAMDVGTAKIN